ncbi:1-aminocyclopropane-1-carboxylate deaminase [Pseudalgibacter alginicilyticus]|uniref:1-aminocyclopropane-1-carboxylate deaminase n=1 Tax=Pseudalgibacter alginicilyticus TaxID=1736674 RepID=A0A0P0CTC3_9FLAO|nr:pyridoxal-phosphate dependent enzyme [Pseudalgibacter alginicilyticus]ALJ06100.1 1-aminocyclopropane-1-carboxylate deaminase [Pseudalgibacter alginicilyticus]
MIFKLQNSINQRVVVPSGFGVELYMKREDAIHPFISGNKYRKLKYNIEEAQKLGFKKLLTFGGAYSNHIAAVAFAGKTFGFETIGVIRGEEVGGKIQENSTLLFAQSCGMQFEFVSREVYRNKNSEDFIESLNHIYKGFYLIPEGGTNLLAVKGCEEILIQSDINFDYISCAVGTGGTISGIINCSQPRQQILGFPALKGSFLQEDISKFANKLNWKLILDYHFGGYAKTNDKLIHFINDFKKENSIPLDPIYTGKMMYGIFNLIKKGYFPVGSKILAIHTGGLQGILGMNKTLKHKKRPLIE